MLMSQQKLLCYQTLANVKDLAKLQRNFLTSLINRIHAVQSIAESKGRSTPGIDGIKYSVTWRFKELTKLTTNKLNKYVCSPLRKVVIPQSNGKLRSFRILTIHDRAIQVLFKNAILPIIEANSDHDSYGFRPGRDDKMTVARLCSIILQLSTIKKQMYVKL